LLKDAWGIFDKVKPIRVGMGDGVRALAAGEVDAVFDVGTRYHNGKFHARKPLLDLLNEKQYYWIPVTQAELDRADAANGWKTKLVTMPKGALNQPDTPPHIVNPPEDVTLVDTCGALGAWQDTEDEVVYELLKFVVDNADKFTEANIRLSLDPEILSRYPGLTRDMVHPGALRYYQEQGIETGAA
ncbi:TAXI family TRAP transporter solute-binding subunit, partial [Chloroflexota bacterium]